MSGFFELRIVGDVHDFDAIAIGLSDYCAADVLHLVDWLAAHGAGIGNPHVDVSAVPALVSGGLEVLTQQQDLHFARFQRAQHPAQSNGSAGIPLRLSNHLVDDALAALAEMFVQDALDMLLDLFGGSGSGVNAETSQQVIAKVGVEHAFDFRGLLVTATNHQYFEYAALIKIEQVFGDEFVVLPGILRNVALRMA